MTKSNLHSNSSSINYSIASVVIYTKLADPYSVRACSLLRMKGVHFTEKRLPEFAVEMKQVTGSDRPPQIVIDGKPIGSFDELGSLDLKGELDKLLRG